MSNTISASDASLTVKLNTGSRGRTVIKDGIDIGCDLSRLRGIQEKHTEKKCDVCNLWKSLTSFHINIQNSPSKGRYKQLRTRCRDCYALKRLAWKSNRGNRGPQRKDVDVSYVYFIADGEFVKIGKANDVNQRKLSLETGNPRDLITLGTISCDSEAESYSLEKKLHHHFEPWHHRGEWFVVGPQILDFISTINPTKPTV